MIRAPVGQARSLRRPLRPPERAAVLLLLAALHVRAQVATGVVFGDVRDESAARVPDVLITVRQEATGFTRAVLTGPEGSYRLDGIAPGAYTVTGERAGFRTVAIRGVSIEVGQKLRLDLLLTVGEASDAVTVTAQPSRLRTDDAALGYHLDTGAIRGLPLAQRNVTALVTLGPGAVPRHLGGFVHDVVNDIQEGPRGAVALNPPVNGARSTANAFLLDGAYITDRSTYALAVLPPMEAVQEFQITSSQAPAEYAQAAGAVVNLVTRSGSRDLHGSAFEYFRNEALDARNYFDDPALPRAIFRQQQFGASAGGPLARPSTYFFGAYEGLRGTSAKSALSIVPDAALRGGDFRERNPIFDPTAAGRPPFAEQQIPDSRIDPISRRYLERYQPLPNRSGASGNYLDATPNELTTDSMSARIDHHFRGQGWLLGRYTLNRERNRIAGAFPVLPALESVRAQQAAMAYSRSGARWLNQFRVSFTRLRLFDVPESAFKTNVARELGIEDAPEDPATFGLPIFLVTNFSTVTDSPSLPQIQRDNTWNVSNAVVLERNRSTWRFGADWVRFDLGYSRSNLPRGQYVFTGAFTADPAAPGVTGDAFADFLLGFPQVTRRSVGPTQAYLAHNGYAAYVQHDWRFTPRLTFNFGARYEYVSPYSEKRGNLLNLDYSGLPAPPRLVRVRSGVTPDRNNFAPRAGLAWRLPEAWGRDLVFRAGYGVYFSPEIAIETYDLVLNGIRNEINETDGLTPILTLRNGFPKTASTGFPSYFGLDPHARTPYAQQWTAGIGRLLAGGVLSEIAYAGSKGTKLGRFRQFNTPLRVVTGENLPPRPGDLQSLRPYPELGKIIQRQHISNSSYHSLQLKAERRFAGSLGLLASFVWSKSIDDADSVIPGQFDSVGAQDERNLRLERGLSFFHVGRRLSGAFVYRLPWALKGWEVSGAVTVQDGTPLNPVYFAFDGANSGTPNRPDVVPGQPVRLPRSQRTAERFFNTDAFRTPEPFRFGNAGRNILPGPGNNIFDLALHRRFIAERYTVELRTEAFNIFNHPNWGIPGPYPDFGPFFGRIFSTGDPRRLQLALRFDF